MKTKNIFKILVAGYFVAIAFFMTSCSHEHSWILEEKEDATCVNDGYTLYRCSECNEERRENFLATGHKEIIVPSVEATCTKEGLTEGKLCKYCDEEIVKQNVIPKTKHTEEIIPGVEATCSSQGLTEGKRCTVCEEILVAQETIDYLEHTYKDNACTVCPFVYYSEGLNFTSIVIGETSGYSVDIGTCNETTVYIPPTFDGKPVIKISDFAFYNCARVKKVVIPDSVIEIGDQAFQNCVSLVDIKIPNNVTSFGDTIFGGCRGLKKIEIPFLGSSLEESLSDKKIHMGVLFGSIYYEGGKKTNNYYIPEGLENVIINKGSISKEAFYECENLKSITVGNEVKSIGEYAFFGCKGLTDIYLSKNLESIEQGAFYIYSQRTINVYFDGTIDDWCKVSVKSETANPMYLNPSFYFRGNDGKYFIPTEIILSDNVESIGDYQFYKFTNVSSVKFGDNVKTIGKNAFEGCKLLTKVNLSSKITSIGDDAFETCGEISTVYFDGSLEDWCKMSFETKFSTPTYYTSDIYLKGNDGNYYIPTEIVLSSNITSIGKYQFYNFNQITLVEIPESVLSIGEAAFSGCGKIEKMKIPFIGESRKNPTDTYQYPFGYIFGKTSYIGGVSTNQYYYDGSIDEPTSATFYIPETLKEIVFTGDIVNAEAFNSCSNIEKMTFEKTVTYIGRYAFSRCLSLNELNLVTTITTIEPYTFRSTSITKFEIPSTVEVIGDNAFYNCSYLEEIMIPDSVVEIGSEAFYACSSLKRISLPYIEHLLHPNNYRGLQYAFDIDSLREIDLTLRSSGELMNNLFDGRMNNYSSIELPEGMTEIKENTFVNLKVKNLIIPKSIDIVHENAFVNCNFSTTTIYYAGSKEKWDEVFKDVPFKEEVKVVYNYVGNSSFSVTSKIENGSISGPKSIKTKDVFEYLISINEGYVLENISLEGASGNFNYSTGVLTVYSPTGNVNINVSIVSSGSEVNQQEVTTVVEFDANALNRISIANDLQVWGKDDIIFENYRGTSKIADYTNPVRLYQASKVVVVGNSISKIVFNASASSYASVLYNSIGEVEGATVTVSGSVVTVEFESTVNLFTVKSLNAQVRLLSFEVTHANYLLID